MSDTQSYYQVVAPNLLSDFERLHFFHGVSSHPPELVWRSDHATNPFPVPPKGARSFNIAPKTAHGVFGTDLNRVWDTVAPLIVVLLKERGIKFSSLLPVRFSTLDDEGISIRGPVGIWISTHPGQNTPIDARDASTPILQILETHGVKDAVIYWYEGSVERLSSMRRADSTNPTFDVRRPLTTVLGMPLAPAESQTEDAKGSLGFYFHEGFYKDGTPSPRVFGVSCHHVLCDGTSVDYAYAGEGTGAPKQDVDQALEAAKVFQRKKMDLTRLKKDSTTLEKHSKDFINNWSDIKARSVDHVDYAPSIDVRVDDNHYTRDFATLELKVSNFQANFLGNIVELGDKYDRQRPEQEAWTNIANRRGSKFPANRLLKVGKTLTRQLLANPDCVDENGDPLYVVGKYGSKTGLTLGRYSGLEGYICSDSGLESKEIVVYNLDPAYGSFSGHGDSGALIFNSEGGGLALLHSGILRGGHSHVTFATPLWWVIEQLLLRYPNAVFDRTTF